LLFASIVSDRQPPACPRFFTNLLLLLCFLLCSGVPVRSPFDHTLVPRDELAQSQVIAQYQNPKADASIAVALPPVLEGQKVH
jgi:hypothetical protein